jgi:hypothetical protein
VDDYVDALCESFLFYVAERFDIAGKELLKTNRKLYMVDLGLRNHILPKKNYDLGFSIKNMVYFELLRRGFQINIGKLGDSEVDFVARKEDEIIYYQVIADITAEMTFEREMKPLPQSNFDEIIEKYVEMNVTHPFREGNERSTRIWLDAILEKELRQVVDWSKVDKEDYLLAMERSPIKDVEIKVLLKNALTNKTEDREVYRKGIDASYHYED